MDVLHVVSSGQRRGAEVFAADLIGAMKDEPFTHEVALLHAPEAAAVSFGAPVHALGDDGPLLPGLRADLRTLTSFRALVRRTRPAIVQAHGGEALKYAALAKDGTAVVYRKIGTAPAVIRQGARRAAHAVLMRRARLVVASADVLRREAIEVFGVPDHRVEVIPTGIDPSRLACEGGRSAARRALRIHERAPVVLSLGALTPEKGPLAHAEVAARALGILPDAVHLVVGEGPLRDAVEAAARARGLTGRVRLVGSRPDVGTALAAADVLILASRTEGMPACVIEAGMAGVPVAAYALGGVPEVVVDGVTGLLVRPGDLDALAGATLRLLTDARTREGMGRAAEERCRALYDIGVVAHAYAQAYGRLVRSRVASGSPA